MHATIPKGNVGYVQYTCSWHYSCRTYFCCFSLALANICPWPFLPFFEISLKNSELKTTHNTFRDCRVHFFRQPFSKQLYIYLARMGGIFIELIIFFEFGCHSVTTNSVPVNSALDFWFCKYWIKLSTVVRKWQWNVGMLYSLRRRMYEFKEGKGDRTSESFN